jgi:cytochrome c oxidase assembly protein subunit 15
MQVESTEALPGRRVLAISPAGFRRVALVAAIALLVIIGSGATVRLTGSGLGCRHWPGCQPGDPFPNQGYHSYVEFSNRIAAFITVVATLALAVAAWLTRGLPRWVKVLATAVFVGTLGQAPLGALTVYYHLNPWLVISHLLLSLLVLGLGVLVLLEASRAVRGGGGPLPALVRAGGAVLLAASGVLVFSGTLATAAGKYPGSSGDSRVHRLGAFEPSVALHVRAVAAFGIVFLALVVWAWRKRAQFPWLLPGCAGLLAILVAQMAIGEIQYRNYADVPWWLVLVHVTVAAGLFAWTVGVVARLWRPLARNGT